MRSRILQHAVLVVILGIATGCSNSDSTGLQTSQTVHMQASSFSPSTLTVAVGSTVTWTNDAAIAHNITPNNPAQAGVWVAQNIAAQVGATFSNRFNTAGTFDYHCTIHATMTGRIVVQ